MFNAYDQSNSGKLDYKEFSALICRVKYTPSVSAGMSTSSFASESPTKNTSSMMTKSQINWSDQKTLMETPSALLKRFRDIVKLRGIKGLVGLQKILKKID